MKTKHLPVVFLAAMAMATAGFAASPASLAPPAAGDLVPARLVSVADLPQLVEPSRDPVQFSWAIPADRAIAATPAPHTELSHGYTLRVTASDLQRGLAIDTVAPGAVVRINPVRTAATDELVALDPSRLEIRRAGERPAAGAVQTLATAEQLARADIPFPEGSSAFRIDPSLGAGRFVLRAPDLSGTAPYVVAVVEPKSSVVLAITAAVSTTQPGSPFRVHIRMADGTAKLDGTRATAMLVAPDGRTSPVALKATTRGMVATLSIDRANPAAQGMWELHVDATAPVGDLTARRDGKTAFALSLPTARFDGAAEVDASDTAHQGLRVVLGVQAAVPGRYEARAVLYGTDEGGTLRPMAVGQSAAWLNPGDGTLELSFKPAIFTASSLHAPFELRNLELMDQGRMGVLQRQARGLVLDTRPGIRHGEGSVN